ncbi:MAG TPA: secondary thiamine-phosphate synthase enzyme YjbQ [Planctomycetota bacterium]|jgi:secondary thiamine-phosphate synthase enzyme
MERLDIRTGSHSEFHDITDEVQAIVSQSKVTSGVAHVFVPHTTAGVTINENADPDVTADMLAALERLVPWRQSFYQHNEGNSAAHIKASMMGFSVTVLVENGKLALGTWQGIYLCEFDGPRTRQVWVRVDGN